MGRDALAEGPSFGRLGGGDKGTDSEGLQPGRLGEEKEKGEADQVEA